MLKITEVLPNPVGADKAGEYVVVTNTGSSSASLSGLRVTNDRGKGVLLSGVLEPGQSQKIMVGERGVTLRNTNDTISLLNSSGIALDSYVYTTPAVEGTALQPAAFLSAELRAELFDELATTSAPDAIPIPAVKGGSILLGVVSAAILAALAVFVLRYVRYDEIVKNPFAGQKGSSRQ